ncbi:MAG: hypothetical protein SFU56_07375 [Capsulimonadales bacterium]|nr:hypothetical protein [Capsulimonadales bacterium]
MSVAEPNLNRMRPPRPRRVFDPTGDGKPITEAVEPRGSRSHALDTVPDTVPETVREN